MRIGILGAGGMADALGTQWARAGHQVMVACRDLAKAAALAERIGGDALAGSWADAGTFGDATLLAVRDTAVPAVLEAAGARSGAFRGRVLVDCTNAIAQDGSFLLALDGELSMAERVAAQTGAAVVKAFHLCHVDVWRMPPPRFDGTPLAVPLCGDDEAALAVARRLVTDLGCTPFDAGGLRRARVAEGTAAFLVGLWVGGLDARAIAPPLAYAFGAPQATG